MLDILILGFRILMFLIFFVAIAAAVRGSREIPE